MEKAREFQKNIYFCFIDYAKAFDCVDYAPHALVGVMAGSVGRIPAKNVWPVD